MLGKTITACFKADERDYIAVRVYAAQHKLSIQEVLAEMLRQWLLANNLTKEGARERDGA